MRAAFARKFRDVVQHAPIARYDNGVRMFGEVVQRRAYIERGTRLVVNAAGEEIPSEALVFVEGPVEIDVRDALFLQSTAPTEAQLLEAPPLIDVAHVNDPTTGAVHHAEVSL